MPFNGLSEVTNALLETGSYQLTNVFKSSIPTPASIDAWQDFSMSSGIPKYNAYVGSQFESTPLYGSGNNGIYSGEPVADGKSKHLFTWGARAVSTGIPFVLTLCDYLLFYPLIDLDTPDQQDMINTQALPRYEDAVGVRIMVVNSTASSINTDLTITYINDKDEVKTGTTGIVQATTGVIMTSAALGVVNTGKTPFFPLSNGCLGVKSIVSCSLSSPAGGFCNLVLVKPLAHINVFENQTYSEVNFVNDKLTLPKIKNQAYLNIIAHNQNSGAVPFQSEFTFITG